MTGISSKRRSVGAHAVVLDAHAAGNAEQDVVWDGLQQRQLAHETQRSGARSEPHHKLHRHEPVMQPDLVPELTVMDCCNAWNHVWLWLHWQPVQ